MTTYMMSVQSPFEHNTFFLGPLHLQSFLCMFLWGHAEAWGVGFMSDLMKIVKVTFFENFERAHR